MTHSKGPQTGTQTRGRCSEGKASVHGTPALPTEQNGPPNISFYEARTFFFFFFVSFFFFFFFLSFLPRPSSSLSEEDRELSQEYGSWGQTKREGRDYLLSPLQALESSQLVQCIWRVLHATFFLLVSWNYKQWVIETSSFLNECAMQILFKCLLCVTFKHFCCSPVWVYSCLPPPVALPPLQGAASHQCEPPLAAGQPQCLLRLELHSAGWQD